MQFRPEWSMVFVYVAVTAGLLLVTGPLSHVYFSTLTAHSADETAVPAMGSGWDEPQEPEWAIPRPRRWEWDVAALKSVLRAALPGLRVWDPPPSLWASPALSPGHLLRRGLELAGGIRLGRPWTLLAAELPRLQPLDISEEQAPLAVSIASVLPQWRYEELLMRGTGEDVFPFPGGGEDDAPNADGDPQVLIYHTHGTEAFLGPSLGAGVDPNVVGFTPDTDRNILRVGSDMAALLQSRGYPVIHVGELFDYREGVVTRAGAYVQSLRFLQQFNEAGTVFDAHPSLRLALDLHRDAVERDKATATWQGEPVARVLFVVGTRDNPYQESNLCLAQTLHQEMESRYPGVSRGVMVRHDARFNQHLFPAGVLVEIGTVENTLEEARRGAHLLAGVLADALDRELIPLRGGTPLQCPPQS